MSGCPDRISTTFWLGATDQDIEGIWKWVKTDEELVYTDWDVQNKLILISFSDVHCTLIGISDTTDVFVGNANHFRSVLQVV